MVSARCMPLFASARVKEARPLSVMRTSVSFVDGIGYSFDDR